MLSIRDNYKTKEKTVVKYKCKNKGCTYLLRKIKDNSSGLFVYQANTLAEHICTLNEDIGI